MINRIVRTLVAFVLVLFPFWGGTWLGKYSPYREGNNIGNYILVYTGTVIVAAALLFFITRRWNPFFEQPIRPGVILFFIGFVMLGVAGLTNPPDLSIKMLEHPEREHLRYGLLLTGVIFFLLFFLDLFRYDRLQLKETQKWIFIGLVIITAMEMIWEFSHHYLYPEGLKKWIGEGHRAEDFSKNYDHKTLITAAVVGRIAMYTLIAWLSIRLYQLQKVKLWSPLINSLFAVLGIISAILVFLYQFQLPKEVEPLIIFFIPGVTFILMYWIGIALLTRQPRQNI